MRILHVGCFPFPSPQGTQGLVRVMLDALSAQHETHFLSYASAPPVDARWQHHRAGEVRSLRSGPSAEKLRADLALLARLRALHRRLRPNVVVAHNIEAALLTASARVAPWVYVAHTRFDTELPTYFPRALGPLTQPLGRMLDRLSSGNAVIAITPNLARYLGGAFVMPPWRLPPPIPAKGHSPSKPVVLYAGNLDGYQGLDVLWRATTDLPLLVATESTDPIPPHARRLPLATEDDRQRAHVAADVAVVPRRAEGGLPMKLLDALARGLPVVAQRRALAGLSPAGVEVAADDDPAALRKAIERAYETPPTGGREWVAKSCDPKTFAAAFVAAIRSAG